MTTYPATIKAESIRAQAAEADLSKRISALERPVVPTPTPAPSPMPASTGVVGPAIFGNSKSNQQIGGTDRRRVAYLFVADRTGTIVGIRGSFRGGSGGYSGGNGGQIKRSVQLATAGIPSGTTLGTVALHVPYSSGAFTTYPELLLSAPVAAGQRLCIVDENVDPSPTTNFCSSNHLFSWARLVPRQLRFADADYALLYSINGSWVVDENHTPTLDIRYADGHHQGMGYVGMIGDIAGLTGNPGYAPISGSSKVRSTWTNASPVQISTLFAGVRRDHGNDPLFVTVRDASGVVVCEVAIPATSIPISTTSGQDKAGQVIASASLPAPVTVPAGQLEVRLSSAASSLYTACPIRDGVDVGFDASLAWPFGQMQTSSDDGASWRDVYPGVDLQWGAKLSAPDSITA